MTEMFRSFGYSGMLFMRKYAVDSKAIKLVYTWHNMTNARETDDVVLVLARL